ncbi:MAG TPA: Ig-like domain-containing protein, partial [Gemmataceae bacterium]
MSTNWWNKPNRRKARTPAAAPRWLRRSRLAVLPLEDRITPATFTQTNATAIVTHDPTVAGQPGTATPYPSTITVSGLTGVVTHLSVSLNNLTHESVDDLDVLLVAPGGTNIYLMSDNGGQNQATGVTLTFDSSATTTLGNNGVSSGTYAPLNFDEFDPDTIPGAPATPPVTTMGLGGFYGINPNGTWELRVCDDTALATGSIAGGWTLTFDYRPNSAPVANDDTYAATENTPLTVGTPGVLVNDTDADGDPRTAHLVTGPAHGALTFNANGTFVYTPNHYFSGPDTFTYRDDDGVAFGNTATVTVNVAHVNQPPQAVPDAYTLQNGGPQVVPAWRGVLANDIDPDGAIPGSVYYSQDFSGVALQAFPAGITAGAANNTHTDWSPNLPTGWVRDNGTTPQPASPTAPGNVYYGWHVLDIDSWIAEQDDQDRSMFLNEVNFSGFNPPNVGSHNAVVVADGDAYDDYVGLGANHMSTYAYLPPVPLTGGLDGTLQIEFDSSFRPEDPADGLQQGTVDVSFDNGTTWTNLLTMDNTHGPNAPYDAGDESRINEHIALAANNPAGGTALFRFGYLDASNEWWWAVDNIKVTAQRTDPSTLTATVVTPPTHGTLNLAPDGSFTYTANAGYTGADSFTYKTSDGIAPATPATTVSIQVNANNTAPAAVNDSYRTGLNQGLTVAGPAGVLVNDADPDTGGFDGLTTALAAGPSHGTLTFNTDGSFVYTPATGFGGTDTFTYTLGDAVHQSTPATVTIKVIPPPPVGHPDAYSVNNNGVLTTTAATGVLANDANNNFPMNALLDSGPAQATQGPSHGTLTLNLDGSFAYVPHPFYYGPDSFTYVAFDPTFNQSASPTTVNITVNQVNVGPAANPDVYGTPANTPLTVPAAGLLANDRDDGQVTTLLTENFDELPLTPFPLDVRNGATGNPNGDWTDAVPTGWTRDNAPAGFSATPPPTDTTTSQEVYYGWHVLDVDSWAHEQGDQDRSKFLNERKVAGYSLRPPTVGSHNHALVADGDGYQDYVSISPANPMNTMFISPSISLAGLLQNSLTLEFDSSFRPEEAQRAVVDVSYDGGTTWTNLLNYTTDNTGGSGAEGHINEHLTLDANNPAGATNAKFRFGYLGAGNDWWWTIDNIKVTGSTPNAGATLSAAVGRQPYHGTATVNANGSFTYTPAN